MSGAGEVSGARPRFFQLPAGRQDRHVDDWYIEPAWTVEALAAAERIPAPAWDPACGSGTIPRTLTACGVVAVGSDLADRGFGRRHDFLAGDPPPYQGIAAIVSNPPYRIAEEFIRRALEMEWIDSVAMLLQAKFVYSQRRHRLFTERPPARIYFLSDRPTMPPGDLLLAGKIKAEGGKLDFLWMVWDRRLCGRTTAHWLRKPAPRRPAPAVTAAPAPTLFDRPETTA